MSIQAMKQALEALGYGYDAARCTAAVETIRNAESALRAAIEAAEKQEPVGYVYSDLSGYGATKNAAINEDVPNGAPLYTAPQQPAIPDGWVLVPVEPTNSMEFAADTRATELRDSPKGFWYWGAIYKAMLAAAPKPENSHE